ncbi:MAG: hypothetical protein VX447_17200 [Pseudomonadota bacterium]|uniref:hypothetical protein n=1 Tax=Gallaecimonas pentaromativorans TaxID=584787 RepID=UPI00067F5E22|nr:hypothetical protein [Gallaecimonas pentaromativorans]MED5526472.1 hypothetical protein [Pseudomonadota bacterium]
MKTSEGMSNDLLNLLAFIRAEGTDIGKGEDALTVQAVPNTTSSPAPWILGTSSYSAPMAAEPALPYAFGYHIRAEGAKEAIALYKARFKPSIWLTEPKA